MSSSWRAEAQDKLVSFSTASNTIKIEGLAPSNTHKDCDVYLLFSQAIRMMEGILPFLSVLLNTSDHTMPPLVETSGSRLIRSRQTQFFKDEREEAVGCVSPLLA